MLTDEALRLGISERALRGREFISVRHGLHAFSGVDPLDPDLRLASVAVQLPEHAVLGGWAAARLLERTAATDQLEVFDGGPTWEEAARQSAGPAWPMTPSAGGATPARVLVCAARESRLASRPDVRVLRSPVGQETIRISGVRITNALRTAFDLARLLPTPPGVVGLDRMIHLGLVTPDDLAAYLRRHPRSLGRGSAAKALALVDGAAESPQETLLRLCWVSSGLPRPRCNSVVRAPSGRFIARVDLLDPDAGVVGEYDGGFHSGSQRRSDDARRQEELEAVGLIVVRATAADLGTLARARAWQARLRAAYGRAAGHATGRRRWVSTPS